MCYPTSQGSIKPPRDGKWRKYNEVVAHGKTLSFILDGGKEKAAVWVWLWGNQQGEKLVLELAHT